MRSGVHIRRNDQCWCGSGTKHKRCHGERSALIRDRVELGSVSPMRAVPSEIVRPPYLSEGRPIHPEVQIQDRSSAERLRHAGQVAATVLTTAGHAVAAGVTTDELDEIAHDAYVSMGAYPSTLGYQGQVFAFPKSICTSVNGVLCHGIPDDRPLEDGDIINIDVTAYVDGMHGDTSATFVVGDVSPAVSGLVDSCRMALLRGIAAVQPGERLDRIAAAIEPFASSRGYGVISEYGGHGIGEVFHAPPDVTHCHPVFTNPVLVPGMSFTIEPMLITGRSAFSQAEDGWTEHLDDNMLSAQFEHTLMVTDTGVDIMTLTAEGTSPAGTLALLDG